MNDQGKQSIEEFEYQAEIKQLLHLIIHSLYKHSEIFLRELISNASDALHKIRFRQLTDRNVLDPDAKLTIMIALDAENKMFSIEDTGIGMTKNDLINNIGTVAKSGTIELLKMMHEKGKPFDGKFIGQFGVGFYSVFMVTDEVTIETRHADAGSKGYRWKSAGQGIFTIEEIEREKRGTKIWFRLKEEAKEFCDESHVKQIIKRYSNFVDFPIYVNKERVNRISALWRQPKDQIKEDELEEFYRFITNDFNRPLGHLHLAIEGVVNFNALIFIPEVTPVGGFIELIEKSLQLYSNKILIQTDCKELLPEYLRFVKGVVDTEDLPLNVSREITQSSAQMVKIKNVITDKILALLEDWAEKDRSKYDKFYKNFGPMLKSGLNSDSANKDRIIDLLRFESTLTENEEKISLKEYVARMKEGQLEIYYIIGDHREVIEKNPNLEYFKKRGMEVLILTHPIDVMIIPAIHEYDKKPLKSIEKSDIKLEQDEESKKEALSENLAKSLIETFKEALGDKVEDVVESKRLVDSPVTLVVGSYGMDPQLAMMMKVNKKRIRGIKKILEINVSHPLIKNLSKINARNSNDAILRKTILQLFESALLIDGSLSSPMEFVSRMNELLEEVTKS